MNVEHLGLLHRIIVTLFLFFFLFKTILLIAKKNELLDTIRSKTKIVDMVLGILVIATGVYLMVVTKNHSMWINMKALGVLICIPLGIVAMKKSSIPMAILVNLILIGAYGIGEAKPWLDRSGTEETNEEAAADSTSTDDTIDLDTAIVPNEVSEEILQQNQVNVSTNAGELYEKFCVNCHGESGRLGKFNAADLTISRLGMQERITIIKNGKGLMAPYKDDMSAEEIEALAVYLTTLRR